MGWTSNRERIDPSEAREMGLTHVSDKDYVTATASRRSVVVENPQPTGFVRTKAGWRVHLYDPYMAGHFARRSDWVPYEEYLTWQTVTQTQPTITDQPGGTA